MAHVVNEDDPRQAIEPRLVLSRGAGQIPPAGRLGDSTGEDPRFVERPGPALERSLREHPLGLQSGIADADLVLRVPQLTPVAPHLGIDRIVGPLDLGALSHQSLEAARARSGRMDSGHDAEAHALRSSPRFPLPSYSMRRAEYTSVLGGG